MSGPGPFQFSTASVLVRLTGVRARSTRELADGLAVVSGSAVFQHTYNAFLERHFAPAAPRNEFAYWVGEILHQRALAERLAAVDPYEFVEIRALRERLLEVLHSHFDQGGEDVTAPAGQEFHFLESVSVVTPTSSIARDLPEFRECLAHVSVRSIYHHFLTARLRLARDTNDFSVWLSETLGEKDLAARFERVDFGNSTLEDTRRTLLRLIDGRVTGARLKKSVGVGLIGGSLIGAIAAGIHIARRLGDHHASRTR